LWAVYGDYDVVINPYDLDSYGISKVSPMVKYSHKSVLGTKSIVER
jgi:hypothetical protein